MARIGMLDVPGDESRHFAAWRALRVDQQPEFRRAAGTRRADASGESDDGGRCGDCGAFHGYSELEVSVVVASARTPALLGKCATTNVGATQEIDETFYSASWARRTLGSGER